jgi:hypothetical protein
MKTWTPAQPLSWFGFLLGVALGMALFAPLACVGLAYTKIPVFLTGMTGVAVSFIAAALMALKLATGIADGRYRDIHPAPWRQQVW